MQEASNFEQRRKGKQTQATCKSTPFTDRFADAYAMLRYATLRYDGATRNGRTTTMMMTASEIKSGQ